MSPQPWAGPWAVPQTCSMPAPGRSGGAAPLPQPRKGRPGRGSRVDLGQEQQGSSFTPTVGKTMQTGSAPAHQNMIWKPLHSLAKGILWGQEHGASAVCWVGKGTSPMVGPGSLLAALAANSLYQKSVWVRCRGGLTLWLCPTPNFQGHLGPLECPASLHDSPQRRPRPRETVLA